jgi:Protein of unknown function (DUF3617)
MMSSAMFAICAIRHRLSSPEQHCFLQALATKLTTTITGREIMRKFLIVGVAALAIAGCSDKGADADGDGKVSDTEAKAEMAKGGAMAMQPGEWETKISFTEVEAKGLPAGAGEMMKAKMAEGVISKSCMTKEQAEKPGADFFGAPAAANCSFEELNRSGNSMKVSMTCKPSGNLIIKSKMDGTFATASYSMNIEQSTEGTPMGAIKMTGKIEGKRVGDCPA